MTVLVLVNDPPYGTERCYNALRLAGSLAKREDTTVRVFLMADAVGCAVAGQRTPDGYYNLERMLKPVLRRGGDVACCGSCMDARGLTDEQLVDGSRRSSIEELTDWTLWADKVVTF
ncbi:MAG TPA: DsrE family protein [Gaiellaceae bacterium]|nr:DsrE family protein [Gaiellaceae bacterium]